MPVFHMDKVMETILEMVDEGIHVIDMDGKTIFYNGIAASHDGMSVEEVLEVPLLQAFPELTVHSSTLLRVIQTGKPIYHHEQSYVNINGNKIETLNTTLPIYVDDKLIGAVEIAKDYSSLKQLSERLVDIQSHEKKENIKRSNSSLRETLKDTESKLINDALLRTNGNVMQASKLLKIPRQTLQYKIQKYKLCFTPE